MANFEKVAHCWVQEHL
jgi:hypothetical protein